jgi:hypothetical protein
MVVKKPGLRFRRAAALGAVLTSLAAAHAHAQPIAFTKVLLSTTTGRQYTGIAVGPDNKVYAGTLAGEIVRFPINADSTLGTAEVISSLQTANGGNRTVIGLLFDPAATAGNPILWVSHSGPGLSGSADWLGKITRMSGANLQTVQDYVVGLPRSTRDHMTNGITWRPGEPGVMYVVQGSNSAMGAPDNAWGNRPERALTGAVLRIDLNLIPSPPLDVKTAEGGTYDPWGVGAPVTVFGSGCRNCYDLLWHTNGQLYVPANGSAAGGNTPATPGTLPAACATRRVDLAINGPYTGPSVPGITNVTATQNDFLFRVVQGGSYGHPNPERCEWVLNGGNPTSGTDTAEVTQYPAGTQPDRNWRGAAYNFGNNKSPDGILEYRSTAFGGALQGKILVARYSGGDDLIVLTPGGPNLDIVAEQTGITGMTGFVDPLDLAENVSRGDIYVTEHGAQRITLLKPQTPPTGCVTAGDCFGTLPACGQFACIASACEVVAVSAGPVCRVSAGVCDAPDTCDGVSTDCPADAKSPSGTSCPDDGNACTLDQCDGSSIICQHPAGNPGAVCRPKSGDCDVAEMCTGASTVCPPDGYAAGGGVCRPAAGDCDVAELCSGISPACPADGFKSAGMSCGSSSTTACTNPDTCNGSGVCLPNHASNGSPCGDQGVECLSNDSCQGGVCQDAGFAAAGTGCSSDGDVCTDDVCDGAGACTHVFDASNHPSCPGATTTLPGEGCAETFTMATQTKTTSIKLSPKPESDRVKTGGAFLLPEGAMFMPNLSAVKLTVRDSAGTYYEATIPEGRFVGSASGRSFKFKDNLMVHNGMRQAKLSVGSDGRMVRYKFSVQRRDLADFGTGIGGITIQVGSSCFTDVEDACLAKGSGVQCK